MLTDLTLTLYTLAERQSSCLLCRFIPQDKASRSALIRLYYSSRMFMGVLCISCEVLYIATFMARFPRTALLWKDTFSGLAPHYRIIPRPDEPWDTG